jgi:hypothetical protein
VNPDREPVLAVLVRADRRLRRARALAQLVRAAAAGAALLVVLALWRLAAPVPAAAWWLAAGGMLAAAAGAGGRALARRPQLDRAAAELDRAATLYDTLSTAEWFARTGHTSPWIDEQLRRAADTARPLDVDRLCPVAFPRRATNLLAAQAVVFIALSVVPLSWTRGWLAADEALTMASEQARQIAELRAIVEHEAFAREDPEAHARAVEILEQIEARLQAGQSAPADALDALSSLLARASQDQRGGAVAEADPRAPQGDPAGAANRAAPGEGEAARPRRGQGDQANRRGDAPSATPEDRAGSEQLRQALDRAAAQARELADASRRGEASRESARAGEPGPNRNAPDRGEGGAAMASGGQGDAGQQQQAEQGPGGLQPGGHLSGPGTPDRAAGDRARPSDLEVTLKREELSSAFRLELPPSELVERQTQAAPSRLGYEAAKSSTRRHATGEPAAAPVPWEYRDLIRKYFLERAEPQRPSGGNTRRE